MDGIELTTAANKDVKSGFAAIKTQYLDVNHKKKIASDYLPKGSLDEINACLGTAEVEGASNEPPRKKPKLKGRNKHRPVERNLDKSQKLCPSIVTETVCAFGEKCSFIHDVDMFLKSKPANIGERCYVYETYGRCPFGATCLFGESHLSKDHTNIVQAERVEAASKLPAPESNTLSKPVQVSLWKKKYDFSVAQAAIKAVQAREGQVPNNLINANTPATNRSSGSKDVAPILGALAPSDCGGSVSTLVNEEPVIGNGQDSSAVDINSRIVPTPTEAKSPTANSMDVSTPPKSREIKQISFKDKLYLAPLTTVGNLPFRRICKEFGADITCSEMATTMGLLQGHRAEWALLRRHRSEDIFGAQICGSYPDQMIKTTQLLMENADVDFIDINCGCPIELFYKKGEGCALMNKAARMEQIVQGMRLLSTVPVTVKLRTGVKEGFNTAHKIIPRLRDAGASLVTLHGRTREQRYTKLADWEYISHCADMASPMPLFGNGDILSFEDYEEHRKNTGVAGCMIARGALVKPWLFTEIKERRHWDISSSERLSVLQSYANYGLEHWGSDQQGVATTRRFLLEWLSFLYRYIPVGILETLPQKINQKPPFYYGRDDLETLMASSNCADWIKISEMLLGPVPDGFTFLPKHKANSYQ